MKPEHATALIEWNVGGHHPTYLQAFTEAFAATGRPLCILSHHEPSDIPQGAVWVQIPRITWIKEHRWLGLGGTRLRYARLIRNALRKAESELGSKCSKVFFSSLYEAQAKVLASTASAIALPFAGLYVQATAFHGNSNSKKLRKIQRLLEHKHLDTIFLLDPTVRNAVQLACNKPTIVLPEVTCTTLPDSTKFAESLGLLPKCRPILGLFGHLTPGKGIVQLVEFSRSHPDLDVTFLLAGSCNWDEFTPAEADILRSACSSDPRFILHPHRIPDEADYNLLFSLCDVIWAVYRDFPHSSNTLAKAAHFKIPILVADGHLMAETTRTYRLGVVIPTNSAAAEDCLHQFLPALLTATDLWVHQQQPGWNEFQSHTDLVQFVSRLHSWLD
jgi:hypothetical protein